MTDLLDRTLVDAHSLTLAEYEVLRTLAAEPDGALRMRQLAERCRLSPSGLTRRFDALARAGLVTRQRCDDDRRGVMATLTSSGVARAAEAAPTHDEAVRRHFLDHLDDRARVTVRDALRQVADASPPTLAL